MIFHGINIPSSDVLRKELFDFNSALYYHVISQSIKAGTKSKKGDKVNLVVASGKATFDVANVVGKSQDSAKSTLEGQGFKVAILENYDNSVAKGNVISQNPGAGSSQLPGTTITIYVSKGKQPLTLTFNVLMICLPVTDKNN